MGKHHKQGKSVATTDKNGDVTNIRGDLTEAPISRPYIPEPTKGDKGK